MRVLPSCRRRLDQNCIDNLTSHRSSPCITSLPRGADTQSSPRRAMVLQGRGHPQHCITARRGAALIASYDCKHEDTVELMSFDPLAIYVNNFISDAEINHLLEVTLIS